MFEIDFNKAQNPYELHEMVRMFLPTGSYTTTDEQWSWPELLENVPESEILRVRIPDEIEEKNQGKQYLYRTLRDLTGKSPDWGILTGIRPVRLAWDYIRAGHSREETRDCLMNFYYLTPEKADLLLGLVDLQQGIMGEYDPKAIGLYIGIPFCPTRCTYCSFTSNQAPLEKQRLYLDALYQEIEAVGEMMAEQGIYPESVYIGGGTPTTLEAEYLAELLRRVNKAFDLSKTKEFTVEAGRPDTITAEKLTAILEGGAARISINPQTMKPETLEIIGRRHTPEEVVRAFELARETKIPTVNADLIAGLPGETPEDFEKSLEAMIAFGADNITVHTLAVKRSSKLHEQNDTYSFEQGDGVRTMVELAHRRLGEAGYHPYYLYRQKQMAGNFENVGYSLPGKESLYNMKTMEENQTIVALGAGGISKVWFPDENRLERVPNVSNYEIYIQRIEEMIERKRKGLFNTEEESAKLTL